MTRVRGQRKFAVVYQRLNNGKLPMTEDKGHMFVLYTVMAVVHVIYTMMKLY